MKTTVKDLMTSQVVTVTPATGFRELIAIMRDRGITGLPVIDTEGRLVGVVSESDLLLKEQRPLAEERHDRSWSQREERAKAASTVASGLMSRYVVTVRPEESIAGAARLMHRHAVQRLPVVDAAGRLVGIVSRGDLLKPYLRSDESIRREIASDVLGGFMGLPRAAADLAVRLAEGVEGVVGVHDRLARRMDAAGPGTSPGPGARGLPAVEWR